MSWAAFVTDIPAGITVDAACQADRQWPRHLRTRALPLSARPSHEWSPTIFQFRPKAQLGQKHRNHFLYAFDLIELNVDDLRRDPLVVRKATVASVPARAAPGLRL